MSQIRNLGRILDHGREPGKDLFIGYGFDGTETRITQGGMNARADAIARGLTARGLARGDRIGILAANSIDYVAVLLGAMRAGIVPVPINFKFPPATISFILGDSAVKLLFADAERLAALPPQPAVPVVALDDPAAMTALEDSGPFEPVDPADDEAALILYTSGSTGKPKGVLLSHASHIWVAETRVADYGLADETVLIAAPLYHMNALALSFLICASGATAVLLPQFKATQYIEAIDRFRCTWLTAVPPMLAMMLREPEALAKHDVSSVRTIRMGSAPVNDALMAGIRGLFPQARIINAYGTTEGGPVVLGAHPEGLEMPKGSVGYPHPEVQVRLAGPEAPEKGVLEMKSPGMMLGYHNRPDVQKIGPDGFYSTGDVFRRDVQGFYHFVGREDDMFVSGGENIFPGEVEEVLETHPDVVQASVVPVEDAVKGTKPVAFVVKRPGSPLTEAEVKRYMLANAPAYQHPRRVWFLDRMLLAPTNKIDRNGLMRMAAEAMAQDAAE